MRSLLKGLVACAGLAVSGCATIGAEALHVSHPLRGQPFGPASEEDTLDVLQVCGRRDYGRAYVEQCLGYRYTDGGFYGDDFIYTGRVGVRLWDRRD